jgi:hypothetical protein
VLTTDYTSSGLEKSKTTRETGGLNFGHWPIRQTLVRALKLHVQPPAQRVDCKARNQLAASERRYMRTESMEYIASAVQIKRKVHSWAVVKGSP